MSTISVDYDVLNQRGSPAWFTDTFANIPTAGYVGRMFISKDTFAFYRDTGTGWDLIGGPGIGTLTGSGVAGQVSFFNGTQVLAGNNNLFWDNTNSRLGINTTTPGQPLDIHSTGNTLVQLNNTTTANSNISFQNQNVAKWRVGNVYNAGANSFNIENAGLLTNALTISSTTNNITLTGALGGTSSTFSGNVNGGTFYSQAGIFLSTSGQATSGGGFATINGGNTYLDFRPNNGGIFLLSFPYNTTRTFTLPNADGTIALTSDLTTGYVPYTGATTNVNLGANNFTAGGFIQTGTNTSAQGGGLCMAIGNGTNTYGGQSNAISIYAPANSQLFFVYGNGSSNKLVCLVGNPADGNQSYYNWPSALSGTLALTSDLTSYLPLTGGTLTGALVINPTNTLTIGLDVASNTTRFRSDNLEGFKRQLEITMGSGTLVQLTAKGYLANYGTDMAFYTATTGGTNASPGIYITGTNNRVGIKTGTPAYDLDVSGTLGVSGTAAFSGSVNASDFAIGSAGGYKVKTDTSATLGYMLRSGTWKGTAENNLAFATDGAFGISFFTNGSTTERLAISSAGNVGININTFSTYKLYVKSDDATSGTHSLVLSNGSVNSFMVRGDSAIFLQASYPFTTGSAPNMFLDTSGVIQKFVSSIKYKTNVINYNKGLDEVLKLRPVSYKSKNSITDGNKVFAGFIAEEVHELGLDEFVVYDKDGSPDSLSYSNMIALLTKAIQELNEKLIKNNIN